MSIIAMWRRVWALRASRRGARRSKRRLSERLRFRPLVDLLEDRLAPSTYMVTNTMNDGSNGSLPWAVNQADSDTSGGPVAINFDPTVFATPQTIGLAGSLNLSNAAGESINIVGPAAA